MGIALKARDVQSFKKEVLAINKKILEVATKNPEEEFIHWTLNCGNQVGAMIQETFESEGWDVEFRENVDGNLSERVFAVGEKAKSWMRKNKKPEKKQYNSMREYLERDES